MKTLREKQKLADQSWEGCDGCTEQDKIMFTNGFAHGYNSATPDFINNIDWKMLSSQKQLLCFYLIQEQDKQDERDLEGLVNLIDTIQYYAVDVLGMDENVVFNLEDDENN